MDRLPVFLEVFTRGAFAYKGVVARLCDFERVTLPSTFTAVNTYVNAYVITFALLFFHVTINLLQFIQERVSQ